MGRWGVCRGAGERRGAITKKSSFSKTWGSAGFYFCYFFLCLLRVFFSGFFLLGFVEGRVFTLHRFLLSLNL